VSNFYDAKNAKKIILQLWRQKENFNFEKNKEKHKKLINSISEMVFLFAAKNE
jgi:hypothetical protein